MPYITTDVLNRVWKKCLLEKGCKIQLRPQDDLKLLTTRLKRRHTALKKHYGEAATGRALQLYHVKVNTELLQISLEFVDVSQDTLRYLVHELRLDTRQNEEYLPAHESLLDGLFVTFPSIPDNAAKVFPLNAF
jgi:hypothetical protein